MGSSIVLAGCTGGDDENGNGDSDGNGDDGDGGNGGNGGSNTDGQRHDRTFRTEDRDYAAVEDRHFNPWNPTQSATWYPGELVYDQLARHSPTVNEIYPMIAEDWEKTEDNTLEVTIRDDWKWHDGDDYVIHDYVMQEQIETAIVESGEDDPLIEEIEAVDDHTARLTLRDNYSEFYMAASTFASGHRFHGQFVKHDDDTWSDYHERIVEGDGDERDTAIEEILSDPYPRLVDNPPGNGPFQLSEVGDDEIIMEVFEDHPNADNINFQRYSVSYYEEPIQAYINDEIDAMHGGHPVDPDLEPQLPSGNELTSADRSHNSLICYNCGHEVDSWDTPFDDPNVRKAVAHVFDKEGLRTLAQDSTIEVFEYPPCRVPHGTLESGEIDVSDFTNYGQNDTERATELLEGAGYSLEDGTWYTPDGDEWVITILGGEQSEVIQVLIRNLNDFGVETQQEVVDDATFEERRTAGEYDIIPDGSSADGIPDMWDPDLWDWVQTLTHHHPTEIEAPMPIGDPDGELETINIAENMRRWRETDDEELHREMMWAWNQTIPECEVGWEPAAGAINTDNGWEFEADRGVKHGLDTAMFDTLSIDGSLRSTQE